jgi:E3 ubiquitin-protein ligase DOA10
MKKNKVIGVLLLVLAVSTVVGMVINNDIYWSVYNYATLAISVFGSFVLLGHK